MPTALLSVYNKDGIVDFAQQLVALKWDILSSGGTANTLRAAGVPVRDVAELVGGGAILGHRVVTLSREIHAALLARLDNPEDMAELQRLNIPPIELVCVDLYPLQEAIAKPDSSLESVIEMTDIGGPTMLRSAAKGKRIVICDAADRPMVLQWLQEGEPTNRDEFMNVLAAKAEFIVSSYCLLSAQYRGGDQYAGMLGSKVMDLCYGENVSQSPAAIYAPHAVKNELAPEKFELLAGGIPSVNTQRGIYRALQTLNRMAAAVEVYYGEQLDFMFPSMAVACKHGNPCGAAININALEAARQTTIGDPISIFGGVIMTNFPVTAEMAEVFTREGMPRRKDNPEKREKRPLDAVICSDIQEDDFKALLRRDQRCRIFKNPALNDLGLETLDKTPMLLQLWAGRFIIQPNYNYIFDLNDERLEKTGDATRDQQFDMMLGWAVGSTSDSNTITLVKNGMVIGNAVGRQDRVGGCELAVNIARRAGHDPEGAVAYSDSFFPFPDGPEVLADAGVSAIFATSGSLNDTMVREFCRNRGVTLWTIPDKVGRGFFGH